MAEREQKSEKSGREKWGRRIALVGGVIGIIALIAEAPIAIPALGIAAGGVIFENTGKKK